MGSSSTIFRVPSPLSSVVYYEKQWDRPGNVAAGKSGHESVCLGHHRGVRGPAEVSPALRPARPRTPRGAPVSHPGRLCPRQMVPPVPLGAPSGVRRRVLVEVIRAVSLILVQVLIEVISVCKRPSRSTGLATVLSSKKLSKTSAEMFSPAALKVCVYSNCHSSQCTAGSPAPGADLLLGTPLDAEDVDRCLSPL